MIRIDERPSSMPLLSAASIFPAVFKCIYPLPR